MNRYSQERKEAIIRKMMPPLNTPISQLMKETRISDSTLYNWRKQARNEGLVVPGDGKNAEDWSSEDKFTVVLETAALSEAELAEYCRKKGLYAEQIELKGSYRIFIKQFFLAFTRPTPLSFSYFSAKLSLYIFFEF